MSSQGSFGKALLGLLVGIFLALSLTALAGEDPWRVLSIFAKSALGSRYDLGLTLYYTTNFIFTGLSVCIAYHAGLFNIGAEGQLNIGCLAAAVTGLWLQTVWPNAPLAISTLIIGSAAILAGGLWGFIPGWLKAFRQSHEVIVTMMMNFIAAAVVSYFTLEIFKNPNSQNPETAPIAENFMFLSHDFVQRFFLDSPANMSLLLALLMSLCVYLFLFRTTWGFQIRCSGLNQKAADFAGMNSRNLQVVAMTFAGALAAMIAFNEILGSAGKYRIGFSADYGFVGIAVALLARNNPIGIIFSAFLFGVLQKGASDLDIETETITRDFAKILQAIIILSVAGFYFFDFQFTKLKRARKK
jgi:ABC-type uncharacterized transport system permease subunit